MPATAGRVRMPANNRVHSSAALQTHGIWQSAIGYDPYAPNKEDKKDISHQLSTAEPDTENAYANFQGLLALAKISNFNADGDRGACKKCGRVGHLKFQCKNYVKVKDDNEEKDPEAMQVPALVALGKLKGKAGKGERRSTVESSDETEEEDSESSDSEVDSEIERIIAERSGKKISGKGGSSRKKRDSDEDGSDTYSGKRKRGRSNKRHGKREISDSDDSGERRRKRRREHRRKRDKSSDDNHDHRHKQRKSRKEKRRRRSCRSYSDSEMSEDSGRRHQRKTRSTESSSDTDSSGFDDSRKGRDVKKSGKSRRRHHENDE